MRSIRWLGHIAPIVFVTLMSSFVACSDSPTQAESAVAVSDVAAANATAPAQVAWVTLAPATATISAGADLALTATTYLKGSVIASGRVVTWSSSKSSVATVSSSGLVHAVGPGTATVTALSEWRTATTVVTVVPSAAIPVASVTVTPASVSLATGATSLLTAIAKDASGNVLTGRTVTWSSNKPLIAPISVLGLVSALTVGSATVTASIDGVPGAATVTITTLALPVVTQMGVTAQPSTAAQSGVVFAQQPSIQLRDLLGNAVSQSGVVVTAAIASGGGTLGGTTTATTSASGVATFTNLSISGTVGTRTLNFSSGLLTAVTSGNVVLSAGAASQTMISTQPSATATSGVAFSAQPVVQLRDAAGNAVNQSGVVVTAAIASGTGTLGGTTTATTNASGVATFSGLAITGSGSYTLRFSAPSLAVATSGTINTTGTVVPARMWILTIPSQTASTAFSVTVWLTDASGNRVNNNGATGTITLTRTTGTGTLGGTLTGTIPVGSSAVTFSGLTYSKAETGVVVTAIGSGPGSTVGSSSLDNSNPFTVTAAAAPPPSGQTAALTGTVTLANSVPVGGGVVDVMSGSTLVTSAVVGANGVYTASVPTGTYTLMLNPPLSHSMGPSEPSTRSATITSGATTTVNFVVQPAIAFDDFQSYSTTQLKGDCSKPLQSGDFWYGANHGLSCAISSGTQILIDPSGGNSVGPKAARYDWLTNGGTGGISGYLTPYINNIAGLGINQNLWIRWTSKESQGFQHGGAGAIGSAAQYKFFLIQIAENSNGAPQFGVYLNGASNSVGDPSKMHIDMIDRVGNFNYGSNYTLGSSWSGQYHTYVAQILGMGTSNCTFTLFMDGVEIDHTTAPFLPGQTPGASGILMLALGANINNGPDQVQSRWFRELGIYSTRPSLKPMKP